jgi:hypothetical protein
MADVQRCLAAPSIPSPSLPAGLGFSTPGISVAFNPQFCCQLPSGGFGVSSIPIAIPALIFAPLAKALKTIMNLLNSFIAMIAIPCPRL